MENKGVKCDVCECVHNTAGCGCDRSVIEVTHDCSCTNQQIQDPHFCKSYEKKKGAVRLPAGKTAKFKFLGTGMISVMPVPLLAAHPREYNPQGRTRYVPSACACRWTYPVPPHKPLLQAL